MPGVAVPARRQLRWAVERRLCWPVGSVVWSDRREGRSPDRRADQTTGGDLFPLLSGGRSGLWRAVVSEHSSNNERWVCDAGPPHFRSAGISRSEEHTSELQSLMRISYAVSCLKKKNTLNYL